MRMNRFFLVWVLLSVYSSLSAQINYFYVSGNVEQPVTVNTDMGTWSFSFFHTIRGEIGEMEVWDINGHRIVDAVPKRIVNSDGIIENHYTFKTIDDSVSCSSIVAHNPYGKKTLWSGTPIALSIMDACSSRDTVGQIVTFRVDSDVLAGKEVVVPAGTLANGRVTTIESPASIGRGARLVVMLDSLVTLSGIYVPLDRTFISVTGKSRRGIAIACGFYTCGIGLLIKGKHAEIPAGTRLIATVGSDIVFWANRHFG